MSSFLRIVGIINAAVWFGAGLFFAAGILPAVFSHDMRDVFGAGAYQYYSGAVALTLFRRFFDLQYICGTLALLLLLGEKFYTGRPFPQPGTIIVVTVFCLGLIGGLWLEPHMESLRQTMYGAPTQALKDSARHSFGVWHGISQFANLVILVGLLVHLLRVTSPGGLTRSGNFYQIP